MINSIRSTFSGTNHRFKGARKNGKSTKQIAFPIVGIGASAGGLEALRNFLEAQAPTSGMAFVMIQHLDPTHSSLMAELLSSHTSMTVAQAVDGTPLEPDHVYLIPPGVSLAIRPRPNSRVTRGHLEARRGFGSGLHVPKAL
jgi:chemotaxis response regulator CheB